jgi:hypothetical protein
MSWEVKTMRIFTRALLTLILDSHMPYSQVPGASNDKGAGRRRPCHASISTHDAPYIDVVESHPWT